VKNMRKIAAIAAVALALAASGVTAAAHGAPGNSGKHNGSPSFADGH
jgi:hypothetical protein